MNEQELCNHPTKHGPCNMPKGHHARFHRRREYKNSITWEIKTPKTLKTLEKGSGRVTLGYAITRNMLIHDNLVIEVSR